MRKSWLEKRPYGRHYWLPHLWWLTVHYPKPGKRRKWQDR